MPLMLIDIAFAAVMASVGIALGVWLRGRKASREAEAAPNDTEYAKEALASLRVLAKRVATHVGEHSSQESAINQAKQFEAQYGNSHVFETPEKKYFVTVGPYTNRRNADIDFRQKQSSNMLPPDSYIQVNTRNWQQVYPIRPVSPPPTTPTNTPIITTPGPKPQNPRVRDAVKKDAEQGMKDDFVVYPPEKKR